MKLTVYERIILLNILPAEGDFTTLKITRKLREDLSFTEDEHKSLQFKKAGDTFIDDDGKEQIVPDGQIKWQYQAVDETEIKIGEKAADIIVDALKKLNTEKKLRNEHMSVYEKFVDEAK